MSGKKPVELFGIGLVFVCAICRPAELVPSDKIK